MTTITTRAGKGAALSWTEADANFTNLNNNKVETTTLASTSGAGIVGFTPVGNISSTNVQAAIVEEINDLASVAGSGLIGFQQSGTSTVARTLQQKVSDFFNIKDVGVIGDGVSDDRTAFNTANTTLGTATSAYLSPGTYLIGSNLTIGYGLKFCMGAKLKPASGVTITITGLVSAEKFWQIFDLSAGGSVVLSARQSIVYAEWWGASGSGSGNDAGAINAAMAALATHGGIVQLLAGDYTIGTTLTLKRGVSLVGIGATALYQETDNVPVTRLLWVGTAGGRMLNAGNRWQGRLSGIYFDGGFQAANILSLGAPQNSEFSNLVVARTASGYPGAGIELTTDGQTYQSGVQYPSGSMNKFDTVCVREMQYRALIIDGSGWTGGSTLTSFINCQFLGGANSVSVTVNQYCDDLNFWGGTISGPVNGTGVVLGYDSSANQVYNVNFFGVAIENESAGSVGIDARNNAAACNFVNCYLPTQGTPYILTNGSAQITASITGTTLTVTNAAGNIPLGSPLSGAGITAGTRILSQTSVSNISFTASITDVLMTVTAVASGTIKTGMTLQSGGAVGTFIQRQVSGTPGGVGVYQVGTAQTVASVAMTASAYGAEGVYLIDKPHTLTSQTMAVTQLGKLKFRDCMNLSNTTTSYTTGGSFGASPWTFWNDGPQILEFVLWGGSVSVLSRYRNGNSNSIGTGVSGQTYDFALEPGDAITITYTGTPVAQTIPH